MPGTYRSPAETGLYYLNSRYYDPELCRFISADSLAVPTISPGSASWDKNLYAYCDNNPVNRKDGEGELWHAILIGATIGAVTGLAGQLISDCIAGGLTGTFSFSIQDYVGAAIGGAAGGVTLVLTRNMDAANAVTGSVTGAVSGILSKLTDPNYTGTWEDVVVGTLTDGVIAAGAGKLPGLKNWTKGRNSCKAVYQSGLTKLSNNTASRMSGKVVYKGLKASFVGGLVLDTHFGFKKTKQIIDNRCLV